VFSLQLGGKKGSATVSSLNDGMGYLGSAFSGIATGYLASHFGWSAVFVLLTVAAGVTTLATAAYYWVVEYRHGGTVSHKLLLNEEEDSNLDDSEYNDIPLDSI
jgi:sugar phosphate permease